MRYRVIFEINTDVDNFGYYQTKNSEGYYRGESESDHLSDLRKIIDLYGKLATLRNVQFFSKILHPWVKLEQ